MLRFCAFQTEHYAVAIALWIAHTHCVDAFEVTPRLAFISETPQAGKSRALEVIDLTAARTEYVAGMSQAYLFRLVDQGKPTLLFDEIDTVFGARARDNEELRALVNVGFRRSAMVGRCVGDGARQKPTKFKAFAPMAVAGVGKCLPDTILDRSIVLRMRRRAPGETVEPLRYRRARPDGADLRVRLARWGAAHEAELAEVWPTMPDGITDRPADTREALLAIADAAGARWPQRARAACVALLDARAAEDANTSVTLLSDLRDVFGDDEHIFSATLCDRLNGLEESSYSGWNDGKGIQQRDLARRLKGFEVTSKDVRIGDVVRKGYAASDFSEAWNRYLLPVRYKGNKGNTPGRDVADVALVAEEEPEDDWKQIALAALDPDADDHGLQVARVRAEASATTQGTTLSSRLPRCSKCGKVRALDPCRDCATPAELEKYPPLPPIDRNR